MESPAELLGAARAWQGRLARVEPPAALAERASPAAAREALSNLERRLCEGPGAPVRVAVFGPTGVGKSKLFNSLIGENLSPSSYRRPFTRRPVYYLHQKHLPLLHAAGIQTGRGEAKVHERAGEAMEWESLILIDAPDFDSVEAENRAEAAHIYQEADAFIFVADVHKYADASVWSYLERIRAEGKRCLFVLNKATSGEGDPGSPLDDFRERLGEAYPREAQPAPPIPIADHPQADEDLLPADEPGLLALKEVLGRLLKPGGDGRRPLLLESMRIDLGRFIGAWDAFTGPLVEYRAGLRRLSQALKARYERGAVALSKDLEARVDPALSGEVYREVLRRIERIDILRYPRRLLMLPAMGLKRALGRLWPRLSDAPVGEARGEEASEAANLSTLEARVLDLSEETREAMRSEPSCPGLIDDAVYRDLRLDHHLIRERYRLVSEEFRAWAQAEARSTAATLTAEHKVKFVLTQLIYNTVVIGVQIKTAGTLTMVEMLTDGILSPLVAKAVGMALSSERVQEFEEEVRREHARQLQRVLKEAEERFQRHLEAREKGFGEIEALAPEVEKLRGAREGLLRRWERGEK